MDHQSDKPLHIQLDIQQDSPMEVRFTDQTPMPINTLIMEFNQRDLSHMVEDQDMDIKEDMSTILINRLHPLLLTVNTNKVPFHNTVNMLQAPSPLDNMLITKVNMLQEPTAQHPLIKPMLLNMLPAQLHMLHFPMLMLLNMPQAPLPVVQLITRSLNTNLDTIKNIQLRPLITSQSPELKRYQ